MNKIIKAALTANFPASNIEAILDVINATPNPEMATEILLGVYESPKLPFKVKEQAQIRTLVSTDEWKKEAR